MANVAIVTVPAGLCPPTQATGQRWGSVQRSPLSRPVSRPRWARDRVPLSYVMAWSSLRENALPAPPSSFGDAEAARHRGWQCPGAN